MTAQNVAAEDDGAVAVTWGRPRCASVVRVEAVRDVRPLPGQRWTAAEERRARRFRRSEDRTAFFAARVLARSCVAELLGVPPTEVGLVQECVECGSNEHGAPGVAGHPEVHVAWSHAERAVAGVAAYEPCGVDVEPVGRALAAALTAAEGVWVTAQPSPEIAFARLWTRKEALVKTGAVTLAEAVRTDVRGLGVRDEWSAGERSLTVDGLEHRVTWLVRHELG